MFHRKLWGAIAGVAMLFGIGSVASAQAPLRIVGALSNFDCYNETEYECEGFEIEIEHMHGEDVTHTWNYSAFGAPTVSTINTGNGVDTNVLIRYHSNTGVVTPGHYTHFGVSLRTFPAAGTIHYRWLPKASISNPNPEPVVTQLPAHNSLLNVNQIMDQLENPESQGRIIWVLPWANQVGRHVELEELTTTNPIVTQAVPMGSGPDHLRPEKLDPGDVWVNDEAPEGPEDASGVAWFDVYEDIATSNGHGGFDHEPGQKIATIMNSTLTSVATPPALTHVFFADAILVGSQWNQSMVTLDQAAGVGGETVTLTSDSAAAMPPASVTVPEGELYTIFDIETIAVYANSTVTITATDSRGNQQTGSFTVNAPTFDQVWLSYSMIRGGTDFTGGVYLGGPAPSNGVDVTIVSPHNGVIQAPRHVIIPAGEYFAEFKVRSIPVRRNTTATLSATALGTTRSTSVIVIR